MKIKTSLIWKMASYGLLFFIVLLLFGFSFSQASPSYKLLGYQGVVVTNADTPSSMFPTIRQGDAFVIIKTPLKNLENGDIIVFENERGEYVIHRLIRSLTINGTYYLVIKGDNYIFNYQPDETLIHQDQYIGKVLSRIPLIGYFSMSLNNFLFTIIFVIVMMLSAAVLLSGKLSISYREKNKKLDETTKYITLSVLLEGLQLIINSINSVPARIGKSPHRIIYSLLSGLIIILLIMTSVIPYYADNKTETRVIDVKVGIAVPQIKEIPEINDVFTYYFVQIDVAIYDSGKFFDKIKNINAILYNETGQDVSQSNFKPLKQVRVVGEYILGLGFYIDESTITKLTQDYLIVITLDLNFFQSVSYTKPLLISFQS